MTFEVEVGPKGKRARRVQPVRVKRPSPPPRHRNHPAQWGTATLFAIAAFIVLFGVVAVLWRPPMWVAGLYLGTSALTFLIYAWDKSAAVRQAWRTKESTLLLLATPARTLLLRAF